MGKRKMTSGRSQENSFIVTTLYQESNCTCRKKKHFLFRRSTSTLPERLIHHLDVLTEKHRLKITGTWMEKESYQMRGQGWDRFILLNERPPGGYTWSRRRLTRKQTPSRPDDVWPDTVDAYVWPMQQNKKAKQRWAVEKPKLDNARQLRGIFFIESNDEECKLTLKASRRKLKVPMPAAIESTTPRPETAGRKPHQDHIAAKGMNSITHCSLVHKIIPIPQALKIQMQRRQWRNNGKTGYNTGMTADESQKQERGDRWSKD